jgi:hypothetical protein
METRGEETYFNPDLFTPKESTVEKYQLFKKNIPFNRRNEK